MISFLSSWAKNISLVLVIISILEMIIPNNKTKKYVKMIMGLYVLFSIIAPIINNNISLSIDNFNLDSYIEKTEENTIEEVNQSTMDKRIKDIYLQELQKDITKKIENKGFVVESCIVKGEISRNDSKIESIILNLNKKEVDYQHLEEQEDLEKRLVTEIQKIQKVDVKNSKNDKNMDNIDEENKITKSDISDIKKFLIDEYGVDEKCLKIN